MFKAKPLLQKIRNGRRKLWIYSESLIELLTALKQLRRLNVQVLVTNNPILEVPGE